MDRSEIVQRLTGQLHSLRFDDPAVARHKVKIIVEEVIPDSKITFAAPDIVVPNLVSGSLAYPNITPIQFQFQVIEIDRQPIVP